MFQKWADPTQSKDYCYLCKLIHRNHAGVPLVCVWKQAENVAKMRIPTSIAGFDQVSALLASGMIFDPYSPQGKAESKARAAGTTTQAQATPAGVCSGCGNGPLDAAEQSVGQCRACQATAASVGQQTLTPAPQPLQHCAKCKGTSGMLGATRHGRAYCATCVVIVDQQAAARAAAQASKGRGRVPLVPGAARPRVTVGQSTAQVEPPAEPTVVAPVDISAETPQARKARILAAMKGK